MSAQGWSASDNPGIRKKRGSTTLKRFLPSRTLSGLRACFFNAVPRVVATLQLWAEISKRLRRYSGLTLANAFGVIGHVNYIGVIAYVVSKVLHYRFGGLDGLISMRLGRVRPGYSSKYITTCAMSSG